MVEILITILIAAYNEQNRLPRTLWDIKRFIKKNPDVIREVLVVDDGSTDKTVERALYFRDRIPLKVEVLAKNIGKWGAIQRGLDIVEGQVLIMDADNSASVWGLEEIKSVVRGYAVFGSRFHEDSIVEGKSLLRTIISYGYKFYVGICYKYIGKGSNKIDDTQCPWKLFHVEDFQGPMRATGFAGDIEFALRLNALIVNWPVDFIHEEGGTIGWKTVWNMFVSTPKTAWSMRRNKYV
ncbi:glycosyltransferase [Candidatus Woesearchaeota archaeon]|nr:glycosyltransferase [Candidatus Woesearchaeota archaeon]